MDQFAAKSESGPTTFGLKPFWRVERILIQVRRARVVVIGRLAALIRENCRVAFSCSRGQFAREFARPPDVAIETLAREFEHCFTSLEIGHDRAFVLRA